MNEEERRLRRWAGDPRLTDADRELLDRIIDGDLTEEFQANLDAQLIADPVLGGFPHTSDDANCHDGPFADPSEPSS